MTRRLIQAEQAGRTAPVYFLNQSHPAREFCVMIANYE